jgi:hypothetical protein
MATRTIPLEPRPCDGAPMPLRRHLSFANVASATALVVALAGSGAAVAAGLAPGSVRSLQIANGQVRTPDLGAGAVTGAKVAPNTLTGADVKESTLSLPAATRVYSGDTPLSSTNLTGPPVEVATVDAVAPARGFFVITANASITGGPAGSYLFTLLYDGDELVSTGVWSTGGAGPAWNAQSTTVTLPATAGAHRYRFVVDPSDPTPTIYLPQLTALFVPAGKAGAPPAAD